MADAPVVFRSVMFQASTQDYVFYFVVTEVFLTPTKKTSLRKSEAIHPAEEIRAKGGERPDTLQARRIYQ
jgi:hypothetical protein